MELNRWPRSGRKTSRLWISMILLALLAGWYMLETGYIRVQVAIEYQNYTDEIEIPNDGIEYEEFLDISKEKT